MYIWEMSLVTWQRTPTALSVENYSLNAEITGY